MTTICYKKEIEPFSLIINPNLSPKLNWFEKNNLIKMKIKSFNIFYEWNILKLIKHILRIIVLKLLIFFIFSCLASHRIKNKLNLVIWIKFREKLFSFKKFHSEIIKIFFLTNMFFSAQLNNIHEVKLFFELKYFLN